MVHVFEFLTHSGDLVAYDRPVQKPADQPLDAHACIFTQYTVRLMHIATPQTDIQTLGLNQGFLFSS